MNNRPNIVPVILCGGSGTRLWPASREKHPKQFLPLMDDFSLLQNTMRRALRVSGADAANLVIVTLAAMKDGVEKQLSELDAAATAHILCEPSARNTGASVAMAATYIKDTFGEDAIMWILPADHHITREDILAQAFASALVAANDGNLVTFGISPSRPDTGYGYIRVGAASGNGVHMAEQFVEKPNAETAQSYVNEGNYLWNSGMFLFSVSEILAHYTQLADDIRAGVMNAMDKGTAKNPCGDTFATVRKQPFDKAIMEKSSKVAVVPCDPEWSDVGSWESLWDLRAKDSNNNAIEGRAACFNAKGCLIQGQDRLIAVAGLDNIVVVETDDAILITNKSDGDSMKSLVQSLKESGAREAIDIAPKEQSQPWMLVKPLPDKSLHAREITIAPGQTKSFPAQASGLCLYTVLEGTANIAIGGTNRTLKAFESADIQASADYTITNKGDAALKMIEVQKDATEAIVFGKQPATGTIKKVA